MFKIQALKMNYTSIYTKYKFNDIMIHILSGDMVRNKADKTSYFMELTL